MAPIFYSFRTVLAFLLLFAAYNLPAQVLEQNFNNLDSLEEFRSSSPNQGQVDYINLDYSPTGPIYSLGTEGDDKFLLVEKKGRRFRHFLRTTGIDNEQAFKLEFELTGLSGTDAGRIMGIFVGKNLGNTSFTPDKLNRWMQLVIMRTATNEWFIQNEVEEGGLIQVKGKTPPFDAGEPVIITVIGNNTGAPIIYDAPFGGNSFLENQAIDIYVNGFIFPEVKGAPVYLGGSADISGLKFVTWNTVLDASFRLDDLLFEKINMLILPVNLLSFVVKPEKDQIAILWQTSWEKNNSHFEVQRATDGKNFTTIGQVKGQGENTEQNNYEFLDREGPQLGVGNLYYRLKQVDFDGAYEYSPVRMVNLWQKSFSRVTIGPNPFKRQLNLKVNSPVSGMLQIRLLNCQGQIVLEKEVPVQAGISEKAIKLNTSIRQEPGLYLVEVRSSTSRELIRLIKE